MLKTRTAFWGDLDDIFWIVKPHIDSRDVLPRDIADLSQNVRDFVVAEERGAMIGCGGLHHHDSHLGEIRTVVVEEQSRGRGVGGLIVRTLIEKAKSDRITRLFLFTRKPTFFESLGFVKTDRSQLCSDINYPRLTDSGEVAMVYGSGSMATARDDLNRTFIFLGPPGAGKGTQSKLVATRCGIPHLSTGDMLREAIRSNSELGRIAKPIVERGELVPDELVLHTVEQRLTKPNASGGFVFDGFPRTIPQAQELDAILKRRGFGQPVVVHFKVDSETLVRRISGRWTCSVCGAIYNVNEAPPRVPDVCDHDGGKLVQRPDDYPEMVRQRLAAYEKLTKPLIDYYRRKGLLEDVDGAAPIDDVTRQLRAIVDGTKSLDACL